MTYFIDTAKECGGVLFKVPFDGDSEDGYWCVKFEIHQLEKFVLACVNKELSGELKTK